MELQLGMSALSSVFSLVHSKHTNSTRYKLFICILTTCISLNQKKCQENLFLLYKN